VVLGDVHEDVLGDPFRQTDAGGAVEGRGVAGVLGSGLDVAVEFDEFFRVFF